VKGDTTVSWVMGKTKGIEGLVIQYVQVPDAETMRYLFRKPGFWVERFGLGYPNYHLYASELDRALKQGLARFRLSALPAATQGDLEYFASRAKRLRYGEAPATLTDAALNALLGPPKGRDGFASEPPWRVDIVTLPSYRYS